MPSNSSSNGRAGSITPWACASPSARGSTRLLAVMFNINGRTVISAMICFVSGCTTAPPYLGAWVYEDADSYAGYAFDSEKTCRIVGGVKGGPGLLGGYCSYVRTQNTLTIDEVWDRSGVRQKLPQTFQFTYEAATDTMTLRSEGRELKLSRRSKLLGE